MRKIRIIFCVIIGFLAAAVFSFHAKAADNAVFHVQTADVQEDGTIVVTVYMTDTEDLGGVDAELIYDPAQAAYVSSELGEGFTDGIGETNHLAERAAVKCVVIYPEAKTAHGELMRAVFKLNGAASYQPQFQIVDLVDGSLDIVPIPYTVIYQQADGSWTDTPDVSGVAADKAVIAEAKKLYGAGGENGQNKEEKEEKEEEKEEKDNKADTQETGQEIQKEKNKETLQAEKAAETKDKDDKDDKGGLLFLAAFVIGATAVTAVAVIIMYRRPDNNRKRQRKKEK